jgi:protein TonB
MPRPKRTKFVRPVYPETAMQAGLSGQVVIEMVITRAGRTSDLRVTKGVAPDLDQAALDAVKQWEYQPWLIDGKPQDLVLTVTVSFKLPRPNTPATKPVRAQSPR